MSPRDMDMLGAYPWDRDALDTLRSRPMAQIALLDVGGRLVEVTDPRRERDAWEDERAMGWHEEGDVE